MPDRLVEILKIIRRKMRTARRIWASADRNAIIRTRIVGNLKISVARGARILLLVGVWNWLSESMLALAIRTGPKLSAARLSHGQVRSLWGVTPIVTLPMKAMADRRLGFDSDSFVYTTYVITSQFDFNFRRPYQIASVLGLLPAFQRLVLAWALMRYDVFHTFADRGVLNSTDRLQIDTTELMAWRAAGKRLYVYAYGADVRTRNKTLGLGRWNFCVDCVDPLKYCICSDAEGEKSIARIAKYATAMVSLGDMLAYAPGAEALNYWPIDIGRIRPRQPIRSNGPLRIGHAPNHTHFKGSAYLEQAIDRLRARGHQIDYVKVQGVPNTQVLELFETCDVVADQFIGGAYGYTALEAMALGRPVLSFVRSPDLVDVPEECPLINTTPDTIEEVLNWVLINRSRLDAIGEQGRSYVQRWHSIDAVALRLGRLYRETAEFPAIVLEKIELQKQKELVRRESIPVATGWEHPYQVGGAHLENRGLGAEGETVSISLGAMSGRSVP